VAAVARRPAQTVVVELAVAVTQLKMVVLIPVVVLAVVTEVLVELAALAWSS